MNGEQVHEWRPFTSEVPKISVKDLFLKVVLTLILTTRKRVCG